MRRQVRRRAGQGALLALLLQLALPFLTVHQATAGPGLGGPFVICTSAGLVWIDPEVTSAEDDAPEGEPETAHHCPVCFSKQLATAALVPAAKPLPPLARPEAAAVAAARTLPPLAASAPPLPARGPPRAA
jgi:hypothetical protein